MRKAKPNRMMIDQLSHEQEDALFDNAHRTLTLVRAAAKCLHCRRPMFLAPKYKGDWLGPQPNEPLRSYRMMYPIKCGSRLAEICPSCSLLYSIDAHRLVGLGLKGDDDLVPLTTSQNHRLFFTVTLPSFGIVHHVLERNGHPGQCHPGQKCFCQHGTKITCNKIHEADDPDVGTPLCPDCYAIDDQVLANATVTELWDRLRDHEIPRELAKLLGIPRDELKDCMRIEASKTAEMQARGAIHFHGFVRLDGPAGQGSRPTRLITDGQLVKAFQNAVRKVVIHKRFALSDDDPDAIERDFHFGSQIDVIVINDLNTKFFAHYVAKYATKGATDAAGLARTFRTLFQIDALPNSAWWPRLLARTAWLLRENPRFASLKLRDHANTFGFRGHFLTKTRHWSVTFCQLKQIRVQWAIAHANPDGPSTLNFPRELFEDPDVTWGVVARGWLNELDALAVRFWWRSDQDGREQERYWREQEVA